MNVLSRLRGLNKSRSAYGLLVVRVFVGLALLFKGIQFMQNEALLPEVLSASEKIRTYTWLQVLIPWVHLFGGFLIVIGLFTRWASLIQIPIVLGAIFFADQRGRSILGGLELPLAILLLLLLFVFLLLDDGVLSWRRLLDSERNIT